MTQPLQITHASEWKQGEVVQLPSGKVARLKKPDVLSLITVDGKIPDALGPVLLGASKGQEITAEFTIESLSGLIPLLDKITKACFIEPRVVDNPGPDELGTDDISTADKMWLFQSWAFGGAGQAAATFPPKQNGSMATLPNGGRAHSAVGSTGTTPR